VIEGGAVLAAVGALAIVGAVAVAHFSSAASIASPRPLRTWTSCAGAELDMHFWLSNDLAPTQRAAIELHKLFARCKVNEGDSPNSLL
jgi:hypothetical protein